MKNSKKNYSLKRTLAFVSALSMIGSFSQTIGAFTALANDDISAVSLEGGGIITTEPKTESTTESTTEPTTESTTEPTTESTTEPTAESTETTDNKYSKIDVEITNQFNFDNDVECTVSVFKENEDINSADASVLNNAKVKVGGSRNSSATISTDYIENGKYIVVIKASGFKPFVQEISDFENMVCTLKVTLGFNSVYNYTDVYKTDARGNEIYNPDGEHVIAKGEGEHPGVLTIGDVDGNGKINKEDEKILLEAIDYSVKNNGSVQEEYKSMQTDLNHDNKTNLADLTIFAQSFVDNNGWNTEATTINKELSEKYNIDSVKKETVTKGTASKGASILDLLYQAENSDSADGEEENQDNEESAPKTMQLAAVDEEGNEVPVSDDHPVGFDLELKDTALKGFNFGTNAEEGYIEIETNGGIEKANFSEEANSLTESNVIATVDKFGNISIDLGTQIAVKRITLKITKVKNTDLAEIGTVKFLNGMEERMTEPEPDYPTNLKVSQPKTANKDAKITATWDKCVNIEGYEFEVSTSSATKADGSFVSTISGIQNNYVTDNTFSLQSEHGNFKLIKTNTTYYVHVRTVADTYRSKWSATSKIVTKAFSAPDKPDNVKAGGAYKSLRVSWSADNTNSTTNYDIYWRRTGKDENEEAYKWNSIENIGQTTSYEIQGLEDLKEYEVYVVGKNEHGSSPESVHASASTTNLTLADMPNYNLINRDAEGKPGKTHIVSVKRYGGEMVESKSDEGSANSAWGAVDGDKYSYYSKGTWDDGGFNGIGNNGLTYTLDQDYTMDTIGILTTTSIDYTNVRCWDSDGNLVYQLNDAYGNLTSKKVDSNGKPYYLLKLPKAVTASKVQISLARYLASPVTVSETYFYHYDSAMDEIMDLYVDDLHTVLKDYVTQETIDALRTKINTPDTVTGEYNPNKPALERELATAEKILNAKQISQAVVIHNGITTKDTGRNFSGLNAWQPLGVTIGTNEEVTIYVGSNTKKTGEGTDLRLICTQYNSESGGVSLDGANLLVGANTFKLTKGSMSNAEAGGALYIQYQGDSNSNVQYSVRVTGGSEVPILDLYNVEDEDERWYRAYDYITALDKYVANMEAEHNRVHKGAKTYDGKQNTKLDYDYNKKTCILGATDILCDKMMYSLPAPQVLAGLGKGSTEERAEILIRSMSSMEDMMTLFYQHKGISPDARNDADRTPKQHLNIRYQRMFSGAFMYAAGNHIGIQYDSAPGMFNCNGVTSDENGKYVSGSYFGWGIAHEIGHCLNDNNYVVAEITNNYYSLLAQAQDKNAGSRLNYNNIFKKVTSGTKGSADQGTQLGMYWQLHLAYDKDYNYKTYDTNNEILKNLFYARMDTYSRTPSRAPQPGGVALTLSGGTDQQLMRLACAAAEKNVLEFFERWGKTPDAETISYASQFAKETRAIMYANEDSRVYAMKGEGSSLVNEDGSAVAVIDNVSVKTGTGINANKVNLSINVSDKINAKDILGYEIIRCTISNGNVKEVPIGFATSTNFTDTVTSLNNRTVSYKVTLIDQYLNRSEVFATDMVKVQHDGSIAKNNWSVSASGLTAEVISHEATEDELPCEVTIIDPVTAVIDDSFETVYAPKVSSDTAEIVMNFNQTFTVTGMKYTAGNTENSVGKYKVFVTENGTNWIEVANGTFNGSGTVYFSNSDKKYVSTYDATALKLQILDQNNQSISIAELDVLGVTGDNVDFRKDGETATAAFGLLSEDYKYGTDADDVIRKGSLVFTGSYKGNPAYNAVILFDEKGNIVGGTGAEDEEESEVHQIILADVPDDSLITNVTNGTWVYWINPEDIDTMSWPEKVRVELYRVNNAATSEGQRMVSDSLFEKIAAKDKMSNIKLSGSRTFNTEDSTKGDNE
ncbi:MAG: M60 family metallopeptidase [Ruminococcus sp.]|nr:M60 family metallopeptidase [Ruminococcus sp.]